MLIGHFFTQNCARWFSFAKFILYAEKKATRTKSSFLRGPCTKSYHVWWDTGQKSLKTMAFLRCFGLVRDYLIINSSLLYKNANVGATDEFEIRKKKWNIVLVTKVVPNDVKGAVLCFEPWNLVKTAGENYTTKFRTDAVLGENISVGYRIIVRIRQITSNFTF